MCVCVWCFTHTHYSVLYKLNTSIDRLGSAELGLLGLNAAISSAPSSSFLYEMFHIDPLKKSIRARESVHPHECLQALKFKTRNSAFTL